MIFERKFVAVFSAAIFLLTAASAAHAESSPPTATRSPDAAAQKRMKTWQTILAKPSLAVAVAFDDTGRLWRLVTKDGFLLVSHSDDLGHRFSEPVRVNPQAEAILGDGENRPKLLIRKRAMYVSWTRGLAGPMTGDIRFSRSPDGGQTFAEPLTINDNHEVISHRFEAINADDAGHVALAWLDKRDLSLAQKAGRAYVGAAVYVAESSDGGNRFAANRKLADHSCECCRVALARDHDGVLVAFWRHVFDGPDNTQLRDFAIARLDEAERPEPVRASDDNWQLNGCPHHGGDLAIDTQGSRHLAWFTGAAGKAGLWYRRIDGVQAGTAMPFGDVERQPGHASLLVDGNSVFLAWQEYDGKALRIQTMISRDRGAHWSTAETQATTAHAADYPQLIRGQGKVWLAWNSADEGLRLWPLEASQ